MSSESPILSLRSIGKSFYGVTVLESIDLDIYPGEVHCLIGENGAGKYTLCKIIAGIYSADQGDMAFHGKIYALKSVKDGQKFGIGFIHQELMLVPQLTVLENIFLGKELRTFGNRMNWAAMHEQTQRIINELELDIKPDDLISDLSIAQQQMVEIAKAIFSEYKVIIFDEPTSSISHKNTEMLFKIIHQLKAKGVAMIYISHRLEEFQYISDKVTVLRDGRVTGTMKYQETSVEEIVRLMVGHEISFSHYQRDVQFDQEKLRVLLAQDEPNYCVRSMAQTKQAVEFSLIIAKCRFITHNRWWRTRLALLPKTANSKDWCLIRAFAKTSPCRFLNASGRALNSTKTKKFRWRRIIAASYVSFQKTINSQLVPFRAVTNKK